MHLETEQNRLTILLIIHIDCDIPLRRHINLLCLDLSCIAGPAVNLGDEGPFDVRDGHLQGLRVPRGQPLHPQRHRGAQLPPHYAASISIAKVNGCGRFSGFVSLGRVQYYVK